MKNILLLKKVPAPCRMTTSVKREWGWGLGTVLLGVGWLGFGSVEAAASTPASIALAWDANSETTLAGYKVYYGVTPGQYTGTVDVGKTTEATLSGLTASTRYYSVVVAYNQEGLESAPSSEITFVPALPAFAVEPLPSPPASDPALSARTATIGDWSPLSTGGFSFTITSAPGQTLAVYASPDMLNWQLLGTTTNPTGRLKALDHEAGALGGRFYQVYPHP